MRKAIKIKENSFWARCAARTLHDNSAAIVFGRTIHIYGVSKQDFLENTAWLKHELKHVEQYRRLGFFPFLWLYLLESIRNGYYKNKFEVEARAAEKLPFPTTRSLIK